MLGVGLIGLGEIGQVYAEAIAGSTSARLAAVCEVDEGRIAWATERHPVAVHRDIAALVADPDVDVVAICLPHNLHRPAALQAIAAGKDVLLEKPMAISVAECDEINAAAAAAGVTVGVSHNRLFVPSIERARALIDSGDVGAPVFIRHRIGIHDPYPGWRSVPEMVGGGLLSDSGAHAFYVLQHLFGRVVDVRAILDRPAAEGEMLAIVHLTFACGAAGLIEGNFYGPDGQFDDSIEIVTKRSVMRLGGLEQICFGFRPQEPRFERYQDRRWTDEDVPAMDWVGSVSTSVRAFLDALAAGRPVPTTGADGRENVRLIHEAYRNAVIVGAYPGDLVSGPIR